MRYHLTPVRMTIINKSTNKCYEDVDKGEPFALLVGMQIAAATVGSSVEILKKLKMDLLFDPAISLLGTYSKDPKTLI